MSNLPVLWVPPVEPPSPEDRPPPPRGRRGLLLAAVAALVVPIAAWALMGGHGADRAPGPGTSGGSLPYLMSPEDKAAAKPAPPSGAPVGPAATTSPAPSAAPVESAATPAASSPTAPPLAAAPTPPAVTEPPATTPPATARAATPEPTGDGQGVRVIDMTKPNGGGHAVARPAVSLPDTAQQPTTRRPAPPPATTSTPPSATPAATAGSSPATPPPTSGESAAVAPPVSPAPSTPATSREAPVAPREAAPEKKTVARPPAHAPAKPAASGSSSSDFADRLATIRRAEEPPPRVLGAPPRNLEVPPSVADDEDTRIVTPSLPRDERYVPRRSRDADWDDDARLPPAGIPGDDPPPRRALRPFEGPDRMVRAGAPRGEDCHYHAYPTDDMAFHRDIRCHWHDDPNDPSIHYTR